MNQLSFVLLIMTLGIFSTSSNLAAEESLKDYELHREFIENRLEESHRHARYWQNGWTTFYAVSSVAQTALWIDADNNDDSINYGIGALKSVGGLTDMLLRPHPGRHGAEQIRTMPEDTPEQKQSRLQVGENLLQASAERAASRRTWKPHLKVLGVNIIAGALIAAFGDEGDALASTALGVAIGEANIWTQPTAYEADLHTYQATFSGQTSQTAPDWQLVPIAGGVALQRAF